MLVCWEWLNDYVRLDVPPDEMALRFAMSGLNHESTERIGEDVVIDLEVTSNRGDCLSHLGVAREAAVLLEGGLCIPEAKPLESASLASQFIQVENRFPEGCPEYTARVIRGVKIAPSPDWLVRRLNAVGVQSVNNVVDVTNYVMLECGQPLHAFDLARVQGGKIVVRAAHDKEQFEAIDHRKYELDSRMVVIADGARAVALGGVMGGVDSEVSETTVDLLIEAARFTPLAIRRAARKLKLHSPSSYRFERSPDPSGLDWASRRCCQLIMELAGGELCQGCVTAGETPADRNKISLRFARLIRVLGIEVPAERSAEILRRLGCKIESVTETQLTVVPPSWRTDLQREADLIEEVARIYGYDKIPEDVAVPINVAPARPKDLAVKQMRTALIAYGIDEAVTPSVVDQRLEDCGSPWSAQPALAVETPLLKGATLLRRSLIPSLLAARHWNQTQSIRNAQLYEIANIYLPGADASALPREQSTLGIVAAGDLPGLKGAVEELVDQVCGGAGQLLWSPMENSLFDRASGQEMSLAGRVVGYLGLLNPTLQNELSLDSPVAAAELSVDALTELLVPVRTANQVSMFPAVARDLNFVVDESVRWLDLASACQQSGGEHLRDVRYQETYRDPKKDGPGKKRLLLSLHFQALDRTLTGDEVDQAVQRVIGTCQERLSAQLLA